MYSCSVLYHVLVVSYVHTKCATHPHPDVHTPTHTPTPTGNAVTVHVARWLGERLMRPYARKYVLGAKDRKLGVEFDPDYQALKDARYCEGEWVGG